MKFKYFGCLGTVMFLSACGGGGGSNGALIDLATVIVSTGATGTVPATLAAPATATPFDVSAASANFDTNVGLNGAVGGLSPAGSGNTVTLTVNAGGTLTNVASNITVNGVTFNRSAPATAFSVFTLGQLSSGLQTVGAGGVGSFAFVGANLNFSFFGGWIDRTGATTFNTGVVAGGNSAALTMPVTGSAAYVGQTIGTGVAGTSPFAFTGNANLTANFATNSMTASFSNLITQNLLNNAIGRLPNLNGTATIAGNSYTGTNTLAGGGLTGSFNGNFFGTGTGATTPQETAGVFRVTDGGNVTVQGSFAAKQ